MTVSSTGPFVYAITGGLADENNFQHKRVEIVRKVRKAAECGVTHLQIREKLLPAGRLLELTQAAVEAAARSGLKIIVNSRFDIAAASRADGVHLPADGLPADVVRCHVPAGFTIGVSTHSLNEAINAHVGGADHILFGPVFESPGKGAGVGISTLGKVCRALSPAPVVALGGIDEDNFRAALEAGASGFAAIRFLDRLIERGEKITI